MWKNNILIMNKIKQSYYSTKSYIPKVKYFGLVAIQIYLFDLLAIWFDDKFNLYKYKVIEDYLESKYNSFSNEKNIQNSSQRRLCGAVCRSDGVSLDYPESRAGAPRDIGSVRRGHSH